MEFADWWIAENKKSPVNFPMEFKKNNEGIWLEMFLAWMETK